MPVLKMLLEDTCVIVNSRARLSLIRAIFTKR